MICRFMKREDEENVDTNGINNEQEEKNVKKKSHKQRKSAKSHRESMSAKRAWGRKGSEAEVGMGDCFFINTLHVILRLYCRSLGLFS